MADNITVSRAFLTSLLGDHVRYYPGFARLFDPPNPHAAIWMSNLVRWTGKGVKGKWVFKTSEEMEKETSLTRAMQDTARKKWIELGVLEEQRMGHAGKMHYAVDLEALSALVQALMDSGDPVCENPANVLATFQQTRLRESSKRACDIPANPLTTLTNNNNNINSKEEKIVCQDCGSATMLEARSSIGPLCTPCYLRRVWMWYIEKSPDGTTLPSGSARKPPLPGIGTKAHRTEIGKRIKDSEWVGTFINAVKIASESTSLMSNSSSDGKFNGSWFNFGWLLRAGNAQKIVDGQSMYAPQLVGPRTTGVL